MEPLVRLQAGVDQAEAVVRQVDRDQYESPTPCDGWSVGYVVNHMVTALVMFREIAEHGACDPAILTQDHLGEDAAKSLAEAGRQAIAGWSVPGMMDGMANMPPGEYPARFALQLPAMDMLVHSWDVAQGAGLDVDWDPDLVADTWAFVSEAFADPANRGEDFKPPVPVPDDADAMTRLVAFLGRTP